MAAAAAQASASGAAWAGGGMRTLRRILIVDDDAALRQSLAEQLELHAEFASLECDSADGGARDHAHASGSTRCCSMSDCPTWMGTSCAGRCAAPGSLFRS